MKKTITLLILLCAGLALTYVVNADSWYNECSRQCTEEQIRAIKIYSGYSDIDCCVVCKQILYDGQAITTCRTKWREVESPLKSPIESPLKSPIATPEPMPDWYYQPFGFPCEYLNPGNQDCICFCDAPMYCP